MSFISNAPWITVKRAMSYPQWHIVDAEFRPVNDKENPSDGTCNVYIAATRANGSPALDAKAHQLNGGDTLRFFKLDDAGHVQADFVMSNDSNFHPELGESGPYSVRMDGNSDLISGMGLRWPNLHDGYWVSFVEVIQSPLPIDPSQAAWFTLGVKVAAHELCLIPINNQAWLARAYGIIRRLPPVFQSDEWEFTTGGKTYIGQLMYEYKVPWGGILYCEKDHYDLEHTFWTPKTS